MMRDFRHLLASVATRPGMYGEDLFQIRTFLLGYCIGVSSSYPQDVSANVFLEEFERYVSSRYKNELTSLNWAHLIISNSESVSLMDQANLFLEIVEEFYGETLSHDD